MPKVLRWDQRDTGWKSRVMIAIMLLLLLMMMMMMMMMMMTTVMMMIVNAVLLEWVEIGGMRQGSPVLHFTCLTKLANRRWWWRWQLTILMMMVMMTMLINHWTRFCCSFIGSGSGSVFYVKDFNSNGFLLLSILFLVDMSFCYSCSSLILALMDSFWKGFSRRLQKAWQAGLMSPMRTLISNLVIIIIIIIIIIIPFLFAWKHIWMISTKAS